jgi:hypothetical protein
MSERPSTVVTTYDIAMEGGRLVIWTVETWLIREGRQAHFLEHCDCLVPGDLTLFRDLETPGLLWSPTRWESREALEAWWADNRYRSCLDALGDDVIEHQTHLMDAVEGFPPRRDAQEGTPGPEAAQGSS